jgi:hypothetical protein
MRKLFFSLLLTLVTFAVTIGPVLADGPGPTPK